jgi:hypothetical protein
MRGVVFNWLERVVVDEHGEDVWDDLIETSGVSGAYTSMGGYADGDLTALVGAAAESFDQPRDQIERWWGRGTLELLAAGHRDLFDSHRTARSFLLALNDVVHPAARRMTPGAQTPTFAFDTASPEVLVLEYRSDRFLCGFAHGLLEGVATHYGETARIRHLECRRGGGARCRLEFASGS